MSQKAVESLLGRLVTDRDFRSRFYVEPAATRREAALDVTSRELEAVLATDDAHFEALAQKLDPRIVRASVLRPSVQRAAVRNLLATPTKILTGTGDARNHRARGNHLRNS